MNILSERMWGERERNALTICSIHLCYEVMVDSEPTIGFRWEMDTNSWEYSPRRIYPYTPVVLDPTEIMVRLPIDDTLKVAHYPYITDLTNPELAMRMEKMFKKMTDMLENLPPPKCIEKLKKALEANADKLNQYSIESLKHQNL